MLGTVIAAFGGHVGATPKPPSPASTRPAERHQPQIDKIVADISAQRIEGYVRKLVGFKTRHTMSDTTSDTVGIGAARRWIKSELERCGVQVGGRLQVAFDSHMAPVSARISRPTEIVNVVATLPGTQDASRDRIYVVSGHYDSRNTDIMDAAGDAPGANDDASGSAAVMEMACVMARHKFDATIVFMTVAAEEQGLLGAAHWAEQAKQNKLNIASKHVHQRHHRQLARRRWARGRQASAPVRRIHSRHQGTQ
ncbi:M28 family peptidase [Massilia sp. B-10]|nr:M28 family peptidase [Massilia sp. B-10]